MGKLVEWYNSLSTGKKAIFYISGTIILGCVGSGLWAKLVGPLTDSVLNFIIAFCGKYFSSLTDSLFRRAAYGVVNSGTDRFIFNILMLIYVISILFLPLKFDETDKTKRMIKTINLPITIVMLYIMFSYIGHSVSNSITTRALASFEIIRPYVQEQEYHMLRSEFHSINSQKDYKVFYVKMKDIEEKNNIILRLSEVK